jgi:hypothetical protein
MIFFDCGLILMDYSYGYILILDMLKVATGVAETCRWLLRNKLTFIRSGAFVGPFNSFTCHRILKNIGKQVSLRFASSEG